MFRVVVLVLACLLQRKLVTTEGHRGTNRHVFYAVQMDGGIKAARALADQHGLEFIQRVSACLKPLLLSPHMSLKFTFAKSGSWDFFEELPKCWLHFPIWGISDFHQITAAFLNISYLINTVGRPQRVTHTYEKTHRKEHTHTYTHTLVYARAKFLYVESAAVECLWRWLGLYLFAWVLICHAEIFPFVRRLDVIYPHQYFKGYFGCWAWKCVSSLKKCSRLQ